MSEFLEIENQLTEIYRQLKTASDPDERVSLLAQSAELIRRAARLIEQQNKRVRKILKERR